VAACQGGRLVVHFTNRKNAPFLLFHMTRDATAEASRYLSSFRWSGQIEQSYFGRVLVSHPAI
jgi:hypothetical protein